MEITFCFFHIFLQGKRWCSRQRLSTLTKTDRTCDEIPRTDRRRCTQTDSEHQRHTVWFCPMERYNWCYIYGQTVARKVLGKGQATVQGLRWPIKGAQPWLQESDLVGHGKAGYWWVECMHCLGNVRQHICIQPGPGSRWIHMPEFHQVRYSIQLNSSGRR